MPKEYAELTVRIFRDKKNGSIRIIPTPDKSQTGIWKAPFSLNLFRNTSSFKTLDEYLDRKGITDGGAASKMRTLGQNFLPEIHPEGKLCHQSRIGHSKPLNVEEVDAKNYLYAGVDPEDNHQLIDLVKTPITLIGGFTMSGRSNFLANLMQQVILKDPMAEKYLYHNSMEHREYVSEEILGAPTSLTTAEEASKNNRNLEKIAEERAAALDNGASLSDFPRIYVFHDEDRLPFPKRAMKIASKSDRMINMFFFTVTRNPKEMDTYGLTPRRSGRTLGILMGSQTHDDLTRTLLGVNSAGHMYSEKILSEPGRAIIGLRANNWDDPRQHMVIQGYARKDPREIQKETFSSDC